MYKHMPVIDVQSFDLVCRTPDMNATAAFFPIADGSTLRVTWDVETPSPYSNLTPNGPCSFWLAPYSSKGKGKVWSKIHQFTYKGNDDACKWCSSFIKDKGYYDVPLPKGIAPGKYYFRAEVIDHNGARDKSNYLDFTAGAHYYVDCNLIEITGTGTDSLKSPISIMDAYKKYYKTPLFPSTMKNTEFVMPGDDAPFRTANF
ncbi:hypothetical protein IW152_000497 [Coemansia sp. BCRC 34962]|nr:hypothetical protein IW152_000497 [Coemansia sp. BCRC 34962]